MKYKGMGLVSVIAAFSILMLGIAMFYTSLQFSNKITMQQQDRIDNIEKSIKEYYKEDADVITSIDRTTSIVVDSYTYVDIDLKKNKIVLDDGTGEIFYYGE